MDLTSTNEVAAALGKELTAQDKDRISHLISLVSAKFAAAAGCTFAKEAYTHRVKVNAGQVRPPRAPLLAVTSVTDDDGQPVPWRLAHGYIAVPLPSHRLVVVTYTAGYEKIPDVVSAQVADAVARIMRVDPRAAAGQTQATTTTGPFTVTGTFATWAVGGQALLSPDDLEVAARYRPHRPGNIWVGAAQ